MRIVVINETFTKQMGYIENHLPKALARLGDEVHVVSANLQAYFDHPNYREIYEPFNGPAHVPVGTEQLEGFTLHRLPHSLIFGRPRLKGLSSLLRRLQPDIVQTFNVGSWDSLEVAAAKSFFSYRLFTGTHQHLSVFPVDVIEGRSKRAKVRSVVRRAVPGRLVSLVSEKCFAITEDCAEVAERFYGVPRRSIEVSTLGVDIDLFHPPASSDETRAAAEIRHSFCGGRAETLAIYTGRFTAEKNPLCLAQAVAHLRQQGAPFTAAFVGSGPQADAIQQLPGCHVHAFVPSQQLPAFYRAADIAVWPTQESISMLDASACGLPVVVSDRIVARERIDGNGLTYRQDDMLDLAAVLMRLSDAALRKRLGDEGARKMAERFSWTAIAAQRRATYARAR